MKETLGYNLRRRSTHAHKNACMQGHYLFVLASDLSLLLFVLVSV
jgi:hypothetical protein